MGSCRNLESLLRRRRQRRAALSPVVGLLAITLWACGSGAPPDRPNNDTIDYSPLGACEDQGDGIGLPDIEGLALPPGSVVFSVGDLAPLTQVTGYVELTPLEFRDHYEGAEDLQLLNVEDEGFEAEVLIGDDANRMYARAQVICETGSNLTAVVGPAGDAAVFPEFGATGPGG